MTETDECKLCGGDGYTYNDYADHNGEHKQDKIPCVCSFKDEEEYDDQEEANYL